MNQIYTTPQAKQLAQRITGLKLRSVTHTAQGKAAAWIQTKGNDSFHPYREELEKAGFMVSSAKLAVYSL